MRLTQSLELRTTLAQELVLHHALEERHVDSVLPCTCRRLESGDFDGVIRMLRDLDVTATDVEWRSITDWFLCLAIPSEREGCLRYYADEGPQLRGLHPRHVLLKMDAFLARQLEAMQAGLELEAVMRGDPA
jgi:hypothetical protein